MVDQELDALLVGALYGELPPADEARLAAHLESHPTDRAALDDLRSTRQTLRESRFFEHVDPPASVSAILLREAARRAPAAPRTAERDPDDGWFARLARAFAARPAVAAALTLVVAVGVAGTLFMRPDREVAAPHVAETAARSEAAAAPAPAAAPAGVASIAANAPATGDGDGVVVGVTDKEQDQDVRRAVEKKGLGPVATPAVIVNGHEMQPKDMDADDRTRMAFDGSSTKPSRGFSKVASHAAAKPVPAPEQVAQPAQTEAPAHAAGSSADGWARDQHARVATLVKDGNCQDAAQGAVEIKNRAPGYYTANVENDRSLAPCKAYIAGAVDKQEKAEAAKAAVKVDAATNR